MSDTLRVAHPPDRPHLIYDGDCRFCTFWVRRWARTAGDVVVFVPSQDPQVAEAFPEIPRERFANAVQWVDTDGSVSSGAEAVFRALAHGHPGSGRWLRLHQRHPAFARITEGAYAVVARNRSIFSLLTRMGWGRHSDPSTFQAVRQFFLRGLGLIYLVAFASLSWQLTGLLGENGILPAAGWMEAQRTHFADAGWMTRLSQVPTLCWWNVSDPFLKGLCALGLLLSTALVAGWVPRLALVGLWTAYLSLSVVGQDFLSFQWDTLLLETGFLAILLAPGGWRLGRPGERPPSAIAIGLLRWLLFRLMFQSGVTKWIYGDQAWRSWTALTFHYETQPLPTPLAWWAHHLPELVHRAACGGMYVVEWFVPFLFFAPRRPRLWAAGATALLQVGIALTGNYTFFNALTLLLCVPLLDDAWLHTARTRLTRLFPKGRRPAWLPAPSSASKPSEERSPAPASRKPLFRSAARGLLGASIVLATTIPMTFNLRLAFPWPEWILRGYATLAPLRTFNSYGLFRVMTRPRYELILEGSRDGSQWLAYEFRHKPGDLARRPGWVAPHQPRLDWQMWFEALRPPGSGVSRWFAGLCQRLLDGNPATLRLLDHNPFPDAPPRFLRVRRYEYRFTTPAERRDSGHWWVREPAGLHLPPVALR
ncbi:MAG: lipase maturation factor family protein [Verrucomicrobiae bacterium]|nr:lipase maturation factor family protein [Verrucomicrobiae bacterium]